MTEERRLELEIALDATPEQVWDAIATEAGMTAWFAPMDPTPDKNGRTADGRATRWEPGRGFKIEAGTGSYEYLIEARDGSSAVLRFTQTGFTADDWEAEYEATARGWGLYFHTLALYLSTFGGAPAIYIVAEGPESENTAESWRWLMSTIGTSTVGDKVELRVPGLEPVVGVLDYYGPSHVGVQTDDALLRFHGRDLLGMSVALGHHYYGDHDAERLQNAWQSWITDIYR
ncbi:SRPBCC domain-containing protein [Kribbella sancticallisti]|uniref:SRPBCC domain-containing protein n=1 Tax=Kribbella sancticallisti TaxID=460087 RepID=A0ABN2DVB3_9ACTN